MLFTIHFVVEKCKYISNPEDKYASSVDKFIHINSAQNALSNVHSSRWFKTVIANRELLILEKSLELFFLDYLLCKALHKIYLFVNGESANASKSPMNQQAKTVFETNLAVFKKIHELFIYLLG